MKTFSAWAIDTNSKEGHGLIGRYWKFGDVDVQVPGHLEGCVTALFKTREEAREAVREMKRAYYVPFPRAAVRRVKVTVEIDG